MKNFISAGTAFLALHHQSPGDPMTPEGFRISKDKARGPGGVEGNPTGGLEDLHRWVRAADGKDLGDGSNYDL